MTPLAPFQTVAIDDESHPGAWARAIADTPHLAAPVVDGATLEQDPEAND